MSGTRDDPKLGGELLELELEETRSTTRSLMEFRSLKGRFRISTLFPVMKELEGVDVMAESRAGSYGCLGFSLLFGAFPLLVVVLETRDGKRTPLTGLAELLPDYGLEALGVLWLVALVAVFLKYRRYSAMDLPDDFRTTLLPVLDALRADIPRKARVRLRLDLKGNTPEKEVRRPDSGVQRPPAVLRAETRYHYLDPWCELRVPLADGSRLTLEFWNQVLLRRMHRKDKHKWKKRAFCRITLSPPGGKLDVDQDAAGALSAGEQLRSLKVKALGDAANPGCRVTLRRDLEQKGTADSCPGEGIPPEEILRALMAMVGSLRPRERQAAGAPEARDGLSPG